MILQEVVLVDKDILGGPPVFKGTRVPIKCLLDYPEGYDIDEFLDHYPPLSDRRLSKQDRQFVVDFSDF